MLVVSLMHSRNNQITINIQGHKDKIRIRITRQNTSDRSFVQQTVLNMSVHLHQLNLSSVVA